MARLEACPERRRKRRRRGHATGTMLKCRMAFWVYILKCADDSYYTGHTDNLEHRIGVHQTGQVPGYTQTRLPVTLAFSQDFPSREEALAAELKIKGWSRKKKEALMRSDWAAVSALSKRGGP